MSKRTKEQEAERQRKRRNKSRTSQRFINNVRISDETTLRTVLEEFGLYVGGCLADAVTRFLDKLCRDFKEQQAKVAWDNITAPRTGILERLASSDEPPQAPHNPREHHTDLVPLWQFMEYWNKLSPAQQDQHWDEMREPFEEQESEAPSPPGGLQRPDPWSWAETGERRHVRSSRRLDQIEGVHTPVPPEPSEESKE